MHPFSCPRTPHSNAPYFKCLAPPAAIHSWPLGASHAQQPSNSAPLPLQHLRQAVPTWGSLAVPNPQTPCPTVSTGACPYWAFSCCCWRPHPSLPRVFPCSCQWPLNRAVGTSCPWLVPTLSLSLFSLLLLWKQRQRACLRRASPPQACFLPRMQPAPLSLCNDLSRDLPNPPWMTCVLPPAPSKLGGSISFLGNPIPYQPDFMLLASPLPALPVVWVPARRGCPAPPHPPPPAGIAVAAPSQQQQAGMACLQILPPPLLSTPLSCALILAAGCFGLLGCTTT